LKRTIKKAGKEKDKAEQKEDENMVRVRVWVDGYWKHVDGKRVWVSGYWKVIDVNPWSTISYPFQRRRR
jgi:hypothetical protein